MPRRIFAAGSVTNATGAPLRLTFYRTNTTSRQEADLWTIDGLSNLSAAIPNGVILTDASGAYATFAGPDDVDTLYILPSNTSSRTSISGSSTITGGYGGSGGGTADKLGLTPTAVKTTGYTASAGDFVPVDTTSGSVTVTLPTAPTDGSVIAVKHVTRGSTNTVTLACGGSDVFNKSGGGTSGTLTLVNQGMVIQYKATGAIWYVIADDLSLSGLDARYLQVSNNLSDVTAATARTNLGLGTAATQSTGTFAQVANNLSDVTAASARTNLGLGSLATLNTFGPAFGDGSDGTVSVSSTTTLTRDMYYQDLTVTGTGILNAAGYRVFVKGTLTINASGLVHNNGSVGSGGLHDVGGASGGVGSFQGGGNGASSGTGAGSTGSTPGGGAYPGSSATAGGGAGGAGSSGSGGAASATPTLTVTSALGGNIAGFPASFAGIVTNRNGTPVVSCGGSGGSSGGGDGTNKGGAGGGGGGVLVVNARVISNAGSITANGGNGLQGVAGNVGGGGGGGGGVAIVNTLSLTGAGTITASGGSAGALLGTGVAGSSGQSGYVLQLVWS